MQKRNNFFLIISIVALSFLTIGCSNRNRTIELSFQLNKAEAFVPSDQMVVWLEQPDSSFVKTLYISEYLAYGGFTLNSVCPDWSGRLNWKEISKEEFDAVTGATPSQGDVKFELEVEKDGIPDGEYELFIEVHLAEKYNELYSATINLSNKKCIRDLKLSYVPEKYPKTTRNHLSDVKLICK